MQPREHPLLHSQHLETSEGAVTRSHPGPWSPGHSHVRGLTRTALLPCQTALLLASCQVLTQLFARAIVLIIFFFIKDFPISFRNSPAPIELREIGLLICRHELIAHELWQLFQEGVCKVISAINPLRMGWDFFFYPSHSPVRRLHRFPDSQCPHGFVCAEGHWAVKAHAQQGCPLQGASSEFNSRQAAQHDNFPPQAWSLTLWCGGGTGMGMVWRWRSCSPRGSMLEGQGELCCSGCSQPAEQDSARAGQEGTKDPSGE